MDKKTLQEVSRSPKKFHVTITKNYCSVNIMNLCVCVTLHVRTHTYMCVVCFVRRYRKIF